MPVTRRSQRVAAAATAAATSSAAAASSSSSASASKTKKTGGGGGATSARSNNKAKKTTSKKRAPSGTSKSAAAASSAASNNKKKIKHTGLKTAVSDTTQALGVVDPESNISGGTIENLDGEPCDVMLVLIDPAKNMDKFFILQLISKNKKWIVYTRWGRTGTSGQALQQDFTDAAEAEKTFGDKFKQKTGLVWQDRDEPIVGGKYRFVQQDFAQKQNGFTGATWQYWVDDGVDGKAPGWYDYDPPASRQVERLYSEHSSNNGSISQRWVDSGVWTYLVCLVTMVQTNVKHPNRTSRRIRRCPVGVQMDNQEPSAAAVVSANAAVTAPPPPPVTPTSKAPPAASTATAAATMSTTAPLVPQVTPTKSSPTKSTHPVDSDISLYGKNVSDYIVVQDEDGEWYDAVLNQCNISGNNNNNKYYRLQMLREDSTDQIFVWFRWGRVGERATKSATTWAGPFPSIDAARKVFAKKYKDKTGNAFGTDSFVEKKGKYVPVEIDNDVEVDESMKQAEDDEEEVGYLPSALDPKTKELVEVLFSKEMRNEALSSFHLDLKKLPLGVPSQQQIQRGIDILSTIEEKLDGESHEESYAELSSRFYTTIPHSFGRSRPPAIASKEDLQSRYDMCNILLDMYSTNETVQRLEKERKAATKKLLPHPVDQHYNSLNAVLTPIEKRRREYQLIQEYFDQTKGQHSNARLLNIWSVDRKGEDKSFAKFGNVGNRKLLWHGTNIAVVAPIITSGLRIMPHSGGRVGAGIYLANLQQKSAQYTCGYGSKFACMFLCEAPLGKQHLVTADGPHANGLKKAPDGFDSVHAVGTVTPHHSAPLMIDGQDVSVPQSGAATSGTQSTFSQDEFLVYEEAQVRLRYVVTVKLY